MSVSASDVNSVRTPLLPLVNARSNRELGRFNDSVVDLCCTLMTLWRVVCICPPVWAMANVDGVTSSGAP